MQETRKIRKKASILQNECVACGSCVKVCPLGAISIYKGIYAQVHEAKCVGCGKCAVACPASIVNIMAHESVNAVQAENKEGEVR